jgi:hypothetical protein
MPEVSNIIPNIPEGDTTQPMKKRHLSEDEETTTGQYCKSKHQDKQANTWIEILRVGFI